MRCCSDTRPRAPWTALLALLVPLAFQQPTSAAVPASAPIFHSSLNTAGDAAVLDQSLVLVVFGAEWCGPCRELKGKVLTSTNFLGQAGNLHIAEVDVDTETGVARDYRVEAVPTLVLQTADGTIVARHEGSLTVPDLLAWLREGRERNRKGEWEGTAPSSKLDDLIAKSAADRLETNDLARLVEMLGEPSPADRDTAAQLLMGQRERAMEPLISALTNDYLGVRIAASEALRKLASEATAVDPWKTPGELAGTVSDLRKWWAAKGTLDAARRDRRTAAGEPALVGTAFDELHSDDPGRRTRAMSKLAALGLEVLPSIRQAIRQSEKNGDLRGVSLLEDVRWAILIPDALNDRCGGVRNALARGKGSERQAVPARLARAGRDAIPALAELAEDSDTLVVEAALRVLSSIGGEDSIPAMAALLRATDSNLRMTAAQALGRAKHSTAIQDLLTVLTDPNEVVVCAALSAIEAILADRPYSASTSLISPQILEGLKRCLGDTRWRVRAAAAETAGKVSASGLVTELNALLDNSDGFVVKSALEALRKLGAAPEPEKLLAVTRSQPGLRGLAVEMLVKWGTADAAEAVVKLYNSSQTDGRIAVVQSLGADWDAMKETNSWQPLLTLAAGESDPRIRRVAAEGLAAQPPQMAAALLEGLLSDDDEATRAAAAGSVLAVLAGERQWAAKGRGDTAFNFLSVDDLPTGRKAGHTNPPSVSANQLAAWHNTLRQKAGETTDLVTAAAIFATGTNSAALPLLSSALERANEASLAKLSRTAAVGAILPRLKWPEAKTAVERLSASPDLFLKMTSYLQKVPPELRDFLLEPARFKAAVEPASSETLEAHLPRFLGSERNQWSLLSSSPPADALVKALLDATNAAWRAAAVFSLSSRDTPQRQESLERALTDTSPWVRASAAFVAVRSARDRANLDRLLAPLLTDPDKRVARLAAIGLLEPEVRSAASLEYELNYFVFEKIQVWTRVTETDGEQRPLAVSQGSPSFLQVVRQKASAGSSPDKVAALLLAQYGDFTGLDRLLKETELGSQAEVALEGTVLTAIALSRDTRYVAHLKKMTAAATEEQDLRRLLQALRGMTGSEARELRVEINKRMRQGEK